MSWVDTHCHLDSLEDLPGSLDRAAARGVAAMITVGTDLLTSRTAVAMAHQHPNVWAVVGVHPYDAKDLDEPMLAELEGLAADPRVVAIGEIGLDYFREVSPREQQKDAFAAQLTLADRLGLPVVLHVRDAHDDVFEILEHHRVGVPVVFHCFSGGPQAAARSLELGGYLSFAGNVSYRSAQDLRDAAVVAPSDRILVETDSPFLTPVPHRGKPNEPAMVVEVGAAVASARGMDATAVMEATTANATRVFGHSRDFTPY